MNKLLVGLLLSVGCISANAANWQKFFVGNDGFVTYLDKESVVHYNNGAHSGWVKTIQTNGSTLNHVTVHCPTKMVRLNETYVYDTNGNKTFDWRGLNMWENAMPDTAGMSWVNVFCNR